MRPCNTIRYVSAFFLILLTASSGSQVQGHTTGKTFQDIFHLIYNQDFTKASEVLESSRLKLDKWEYQILHLDLLWWEAISSNTDRAYEHFESALNTYHSDLNRDQNKHKLEELIILSYGFRLDAHKGHIFTLMVDYLKINKRMNQIETESLSADQKEILKIYQALFTIGKGKVIFPDKSLREEGIEILERHMESHNPVYRTISCYFLSKIYLEVDEEPAKARIYCEHLCQHYPGNQIFLSNLALCDHR